MYQYRRSIDEHLPSALRVCINTCKHLLRLRSLLRFGSALRRRYTRLLRHLSAHLFLVELLSTARAVGLCAVARQRTVRHAALGARVLRQRALAHAADYRKGAATQRCNAASTRSSRSRSCRRSRGRRRRGGARRAVSSLRGGARVLRAVLVKHDHGRSGRVRGDGARRARAVAQARRAQGAAHRQRQTGQRREELVAHCAGTVSVLTMRGVTRGTLAWLW